MWWHMCGRNVSGLASITKEVLSKLINLCGGERCFSLFGEIQRMNRHKWCPLKIVGVVEVSFTNHNPGWTEDVATKC